MNRERENPTLRAFKELRGSDATIADLAVNKPIKAGDIEAIREAGRESREITALIKTYKEPSKIKGVSRES